MTKAKMVKLNPTINPTVNSIKLSGIKLSRVFFFILLILSLPLALAFPEPNLDDPFLDEDFANNEDLGLVVDKNNPENNLETISEQNQDVKQDQDVEKSPNLLKIIIGLFILVFVLHYLSKKGFFKKLFQKSEFLPEEEKMIGSEKFFSPWFKPGQKLQALKSQHRQDVQEKERRNFLAQFSQIKVKKVPENISKLKELVREYQREKINQEIGPIKISGKRKKKSAFNRKTEKNQKVRGTKAKKKLRKETFTQLKKIIAKK